MQFLFIPLHSLFSLLKVSEPVEKAPVADQHPSQLPFIGAMRQGNLCADSMDALEGDTVGLSPCHGQGRNQVLAIYILHIVQRDKSM